MNDCEYVRLVQNTWNLYVEHSSPFSLDLNFSMGWDQRSRGTLSALTELFPFLNSVQILWNSLIFPFTFPPSHPPAQLMPHNWSTGLCHLSRARCNNTWLESSRISIFPMGCSIASSLVFPAFGCAFLKYPQPCLSRTGS